MYLVRHGETELNKLNRVQGWVDSPLTEDGLEIAILWGLGLRKIDFDIVYSSDLLRAVRTAKLISEQNNQKEIPYYALKNLREISFGQFGGKCKNIYKTVCSRVLFGEENLSFLDEKMKAKEITPKDLINAGCSLDISEQSETYNSFENRIVSEVKKIFERAAKNGDKKILLVGHGIAIYALLNKFSNGSVDYISDIKNASVSRLKYKNDEIIVEEVVSMEYVKTGKN